MITNGISIPTNIGNDIIESGQLDLIKLTANRNYMGLSTFLSAIKTGNIEIIKYIYNIMSSNILNANNIWLTAISSERLDIIQCLHGELGIKLTDELMQSACLRKCWDIVEYLISRNGPIHVFNYDKLQLDNPDLASKVNPATIIPDLPVTVKRTGSSAWDRMW